VVILVGEQGQIQQWLNWRQGKEAIPVELSSLPAALRSKREMPREIRMV